MSHVTDMGKNVQDAMSFNGDVSRCNASRVTDMTRGFGRSMVRIISKWDVWGGTNMTLGFDLNMVRIMVWTQSGCRQVNDVRC